jgi:hypothetical protein
VHIGQGNSGAGAAAAAALTTDALQLLLQAGSGPDRICQELAGIFRVRPTEIALLQLDSKVLRFLYPEELKALGMIPLSSPSIAAHTAVSGEPELFNNFAQIKHASVFETVRLGKADSAEKPVQLPIQKLMSAPILYDSHKVLGVLQISRKGQDLSSSGPDFTAEDLKQLQVSAKALSQASFLRSVPKK